MKNTTLWKCKGFEFCTRIIMIFLILSKKKKKKSQKKSCYIWEWNCSNIHVIYYVFSHETNCYVKSFVLLFHNTYNKNCDDLKWEKKRFIIKLSWFFFQITKLQAAIKFGEEDLPGAKVSCMQYIYDPKYSYI